MLTLRRPLGALLLLALACVPARAAEPRPLPAEVRQALDDVLACERPGGGWTYVCDPATGPYGAATKIVIRATQVASVLGLASWDLLVLRSPGTPAAGLVLLEGYRLSGDERYLDAARRAGDLLVATQLRSGGWASEMPLSGNDLTWWFRLANRWTALDDDVTPGAARFLAELWSTTRDPRYRAAAERAFDLLVASQLEGGGFPLTAREPRLLREISPSFEDLPSTNDAATSGPIEALLVGARLLGRDDLLAAARRAGDWLLRVQGPPRQAAWAQQYELDGRPAPGRRFEPAGYAAWESREMLDALLDLADATGDRRYCAAVPGAVDWFVRSAIAPGCWARLYAAGSNEPLYVARDGQRVRHPPPPRPARPRREGRAAQLRAPAAAAAHPGRRRPLPGRSRRRTAGRARRFAAEPAAANRPRGDAARDPRAAADLAVRRWKPLGPLVWHANARGRPAASQTRAARRTALRVA